MKFRSRVHKGHSARKFRRHGMRTKAINLAPPPSRGGIRL